MPEDDTPERPAVEPIRHAPSEEAPAPRPEPPSPPEAVDMLLHRVTFPATKAEIVQRVGGKEVALGAKRVTMDALLADVPGDAYATRETVARLVAMEIEKRGNKGRALGE